MSSGQCSVRSSGPGGARSAAGADAAGSKATAGRENALSSRCAASAAVFRENRPIQYPGTRKGSRRFVPVKTTAPPSESKDRQLFRSQWQAQPGDGAISVGARLEGQRPPVGLGDLPGQGQADARASGLGGEE